MDNLDDVLGDLLGELEGLTQQLEDGPPTKPTQPSHPPPPPNKPIANKPPPQNTNKPSNTGRDSLPRDFDDGGQKFNTLKRAGQGEKSFTHGGFVNYHDDNEDISLEGLTNDIEQEQSKQPGITEEELATLSPVLLELDGLVNSLCQSPPATPIPATYPSNKYTPPMTPTNPQHPPIPNKPPTPPTHNNTPPTPQEPTFKPPLPKKPKPPPKPHVHHMEDTHPHKDPTPDEPPTQIDNISVTTTTSSVSDVDSETSGPNMGPNIMGPNVTGPASETNKLVYDDISKLEEKLNLVENLDGAEMSVEEREERIKSEKMREALEKMKEARIQKFVVKVYNKDDSSKTVVIDERMTVRVVMKQLIEKNHYDTSSNWALIEELPSLFMDRMFEEHEKPCEIMTHWTRDTTNQLRFVERKDKYALFKNPQHYLLSQSDNQDQMQERHKQTLLEEFFSGKGPSSGVPEVEGFLHIKSEGKSWSRKYCVLRSSGLYVSKGGEPKKGKKVSDLTCLIMFEQSLLYLGRGWKKRFKSPFDYGFALKRPEFQIKSKHIKYLCCEDFKSLMRWTVGIRLAKYGKQLLDNYEKTNEDMKSQSVVASHFAFRQQQMESAANKSPKKVDHNKPSNPTRGMGVKNIFEGAWKRAEADAPLPTETTQVHTEDRNQSNVTRAKSVWKPNKKSTNWWDLEEDQQEDEMPEPTQQTQAPPSPPIPPPAEDLPPPPPMGEYDMPPPPMDTQYYPPPPPPGNKPTFMSYGDPLPPPPPPAGGMPPPPTMSMPPPPPATSMPPPPPLKPSKKPPPPLPQKHNYSNNNNHLPRHDSLEDDPPLFQPPPPFKPSPLTCYYSNLTYSSDDFPPPPPFVQHLKESFAGVNEAGSNLPTKNILSQIKSKSPMRFGLGKRAPPPPRRNAGTRLSSKKR
uniref:amyloid beta A4 precursor protein-binding family B member 1-interacting protein-like isoform X2 n=1 Tax=Ciona intestinalis TaxID=7719 RepID=UPI000EF47ACC|nr:amyloid beta A4 precursor protein-binding family B member 1-interacting protein-like isoform X2 [Ciona intestinalis]|eukprot:XP_026695677.1 amyloid beta A4 precursor protein-binding family B member 1-interacting protein-like isoform X2 [Ciona intestinalis]